MIMDYSEIYVNEDELEIYFEDYFFKSRELAELLVGKMGKAGVTVSAAESCTGGLIGAVITDIPGASDIYCGGMITYNNDIKISVLGVSPDTIEKYTEVSFQTAHEMAVLVREKFNSRIGVSVTGFAGPSGGNDKDPVGTVYAGVQAEEFSRVYRLSVGKDKTREQTRYAAVCFLLSLLNDSDIF